MFVMLAKQLKLTRYELCLLVSPVTAVVFYHLDVTKGESFYRIATLFRRLVTCG